MTNYSLTEETADTSSHRCTSDLAQLQHHGSIAWECTVCHRPVYLERVVEMLRERAVAQDAATRLHALRGTEERIEFRSVNTPEMSEALYRARISGAI